MWNFKYPKIVNWSGLLLFFGMGIILPIIGLVVSGMLLKKKKKIFGITVSIILLPYIVVTGICGFFLCFGGITRSVTDDLEDYKQYDKEVVKMLECYGDIFPEKDEPQIKIVEYNYEYIRTLNDEFYIHIKTQYQDTESADEKINQLKETYGISILSESETEREYEYGDCSIKYNSENREIVYRLAGD